MKFALLQKAKDKFKSKIEPPPDPAQQFMQLQLALDSLVAETHAPETEHQKVQSKRNCEELLINCLTKVMNATRKRRLQEHLQDMILDWLLPEKKPKAESHKRKDGEVWEIAKR